MAHSCDSDVWMQANIPVVVVNRKAVERVASGHPWIFASDVLERGAATPGGVVQVTDQRKRIVGSAHYSSTSQITLRVLSTGTETIDADFFRTRIRAAAAFRERIISGTDAYRLVYSEADRLPGLVVDRYGEYLVLQTLSQGMDAAKSVIVDCLNELFHPLGIVGRNDAPIRQKESLPLEITLLSGAAPEQAPITMNGLKLEADLLKGQKTGVFLDQRENYEVAARYARGRALDCFTCTGGFALHMAKTCEHVVAVDSSEEALRAAKRNADANGLANVEFREANVFDLLSSHAFADKQFSTIVLDPPAFAKSRSAMEGAIRGYKEINYRALRMLDSGGILVTCSCSHHMSEAELLQTVASAALDARKTLRVLERLTQSKDHPILLTVPETHYLKCLILEVV
jgi:23S rRNA (cytosine1962-C5)-methyltransferase